ncbi:alpha-galactosidase [Exilibacterium tricleocarpae]|uniref:alpha-galactosidase n=1 Tax=Exilibacterium tricleocarpae TaxID=2591008 RepID=UPI0015D4110A|nr:alpha-galactosidase [Exilibacterium tricleocarpae]
MLHSLLLCALLLVSATVLAVPPAAVDERFRDCLVSLKDDTLILRNSRLERHFRWNDGHLVSILLRDRQRRRSWPLAGTAPDFDPGLPALDWRSRLEVEQVAASSLQPAHLRVVVTSVATGLQVRRVCQVFPDTPAIGCHLELRGAADQWAAPAAAAPPRAPIEMAPIETPTTTAIETPTTAIETPIAAIETPTTAAIETPIAANKTSITAIETPIAAIKTPITAIETPTAAIKTAIKTPITAVAAVEPVLERLQLQGPHWQARIVSFTAATDHNDNLVQHRHLLPYRQPQQTGGNLLALRDLSGAGQVWVLKQSPAGADQLAYPGYDFALQAGDIRVAGTGLDPALLTPSAWLPTYGAVVGVADDDELSLLQALRTYQDRRRRYRAQRDSMVVMNTWGDRNRDARLGEAFALAELEAGAALGVSVLQLDDGWQAGLSKNSADRSGSLWEDWRTESWRPHPQRFPRGLGPVVSAARAHNMELGLWFNPSAANSFAKWRRDADILLGLYREHGIRVFKIDGIEVPDKTADTNLRHLLQRVSEASGGDIVVNLDVTAGRRPGYHYLTRYGNLFLQNRYTDWANYYPYRTLRNLWQLARYVPPQQLQIEFLNIYRNADKYGEEDPFAPARVGFEYAFAVTMMAQPLAFFEATGLPPVARRYGTTIKRYRQLQAGIHSGQIFPLGREPNGRQWTGFQSIVDDRSGYLLVLRERHRRSQQPLVTWLPPGAQVRFERLLGRGMSFEGRVDAEGRVNFQLPDKHSYVLYRYRLAQVLNPDSG